MLSLRVVILRHTTRQGSHFDWLMENPQTSTVAPALLWAARVEQPPWLWRDDRRQLLTPLAPHRRHYLQYQGLLSQGRGSVTRVAQGKFHPLCWTPSLLRLQIRWQSPCACEPREMEWLSSPMLVEVNTSQQYNWFVTTPDVAGIIPSQAV